MHDLINITVQTQKPTLVNTLEVGTLFSETLELSGLKLITIELCLSEVHLPDTLG